MFASEITMAAPLTPVDAPHLLEIPGKLHKHVAGTTNGLGAMRTGFSLLSQLPHRIVKKMVYVADGEFTDENGQVTGFDETLRATTSACREAWISINTINVGGPAGGKTLAEISAHTVNGRHYDAQTFAALASAVEREDFRPHHRQAATVLCIDVSSSMAAAMPGESGISRIQACQQAFLNYLMIQRKRHGGVYA